MINRNDFGNYLNSLGLCGVGVEVGVQRGIYSEKLLSTWKGQKLYLVDVWRFWDKYRDWGDLSSEAQRGWLLTTIERMEPFWDRIQIIQEESVRAARLFDDNSLDFVYIDACHDYSSVLMDIQTWWPKVKVGGILAGHDYVDLDITYEGYTLSFGVKRAVNQMFEKVYQTQETFPSWWLFK
jgi:hypothetical protein